MTSAANEMIDPITTEVIRYGLEAAAEQMTTVLTRTAFSPAIYDIHDCAAALYDNEVRLLAQGDSMPGFLGTLGASIRSTVDRVGGAKTLREGDVLFSTYGYDIGTHSPDAVVILPGFFEGELVGYAAIKAHQADIGAKDIYPIDATDIWQEGTIFPGVRIYSAGVRNEDMYRTILANSRAPQALAGDLSAQIGSARVGLNELNRLLERYGRDRFRAAVERMFDYGEAVVRHFISEIPDGTYLASGAMDDDGVGTDAVPVAVAVNVVGDEITIDLSESADQQVGPVNCPRAMSEGGMRVGVLTLAGVTKSFNEGYFRPITVVTRPGSLFEPQPPAPIFLYHWSWPLAMDLMHRALADCIPEHVPAASGGDLCGIGTFGFDAHGVPWYTAAAHLIGMGASSRGDSTTPLIFMPSSGYTPSAAEVMELDGHVTVERIELAQDSGGAGRFRGGLGVNALYRCNHDQFALVMTERTKSKPWGLHGGESARANSVHVHLPDGSTQQVTKAARLPLPAGALIEAASAGGGGFGSPDERMVDAIHRDIAEGYVSEAAAREFYPHAFSEHDPARDSSDD